MYLKLVHILHKIISLSTSSLLGIQVKNLHFNDQRLISLHAKIISPTHHFVDAVHSPGLCDHPPGLLRVEPHTLSHIVPEGEGEIVKYSGTINTEPKDPPYNKRDNN